LADTQTAQLLTVSNTNALGGSEDLDWTVTEAASDCAAPSDLTWISAAPAAGSTGQGTSADLTVTFDSTGLVAPAAYSGLLCLNNNDPLATVVAVPVSLQVIFNFDGFLAPISNAPAVNQNKAGSTIPVKFSLGGNYGLDIFANGYPASQRLDCHTLQPIGPLEPTSTPGNSDLTYNGSRNLYQLNWKTTKSWANTCRLLIVGFNDGTQQIAYFKFTSN
jgi:hypothetical protein